MKGKDRFSTESRVKRYADILWLEAIIQASPDRTISVKEIQAITKNKFNRWNILNMLTAMKAEKLHSPRGYYQVPFYPASLEQALPKVKEILNQRRGTNSQYSKDALRIANRKRMDAITGMRYSKLTESDWKEIESMQLDDVGSQYIKKASDQITIAFSKRITALYNLTLQYSRYLPESELKGFMGSIYLDISLHLKEEHAHKLPEDKRTEYNKKWDSIEKEFAHIVDHTLMTAILARAARLREVYHSRTPKQEARQYENGNQTHSCATKSSLKDI